MQSGVLPPEQRYSPIQSQEYSFQITVKYCTVKKLMYWFSSSNTLVFEMCFFPDADSVYCLSLQPWATINTLLPKSQTNSKWTVKMATERHAATENKRAEQDRTVGRPETEHNRHFQRGEKENRAGFWEKSGSDFYLRKRAASEEAETLTGDSYTHLRRQDRSTRTERGGEREWKESTEESHG